MSQVGMRLRAGRSIRGGAVVAAIAFGWLIAAMPARAADGDLDARFDYDGLSVQDCGGNDEAQAVAIQPDGKILLAGFNCIVRLTPTGGLDKTFSGDGRQTLSFSSIRPVA